MGKNVLEGRATAHESSPSLIECTVCGALRHVEFRGCRREICPFRVETLDSLGSID